MLSETKKKIRALGGCSTADNSDDGGWDITYQNGGNGAGKGLKVPDRDVTF
jgi:hypothetical protein